MSYRKCEPSDYDKLAPPADEAIDMLELYKTDPSRNLFCIDWDEHGDDLDIYGNWQDESKYQRVEFVLVPCNYLHNNLGWTDDFIPDGCVEDL